MRATASYRWRSSRLSGLVQQWLACSCMILQAQGLLRVSISRHGHEQKFTQTSRVTLQDTVVAIRQGGDKLVVTSMHPENYPENTFSIDPDQVGVVCLRCCV